MHNSAISCAHHTLDAQQLLCGWWLPCWKLQIFIACYHHSRRFYQMALGMFWSLLSEGSVTQRASIHCHKTSEWESFSAIKKGNLAICDNMGNKADSERQALFDCTYYVESKKPRQTTEELRDTENWSVVIRVGEWTEGVKKVHFITIDSDQILLWLFCYMHKDQIILWYTRN